MKKYIIILFACITVLFLLFAFTTSHSFLDFAVNLVNSYTGMQIEVGSLSFPGEHRIVMRDLTIKDDGKDGFNLVLPYLEVRVRLKDILHKNIEEIILRKPALSFVYKEGKISMPFTFKKISVNDADVIIRREKGNPFHIGSITVSLNNRFNKKLADLRGSAFIAELDSTVSFDAEMDIDKFSVEKGRLKVSPVNLEYLSAGSSMSYFRNKKVKGACTLVIDAARGKDGSSGSIRWKTLLSIRGLSVRSKTLALDLKDKPFELSSRGIYAPGQDDIKIEALSAHLAGLNLMTLNGTVKRIFSGSPEIAIAAEMNNIPIRKVKDLLSGASVKWLDEIDIAASGKAGVLAAGSLNSPMIQGEISLLGKKLVWKNVSLASFEVKLPLKYENKNFSLKKVLIKAAECAYLNLPDKKNPDYKLQNVKLFIPAFTYKDLRLKADAFQISADSAVIPGKKKDFTSKDIFIKGDLEGDLDKQWLRVNNLLINTDFAEGITGDVYFTINRETAIYAGLKYDGINVERLSKKYFHELLAQKSLNIKGNGKLQGALEITIPENASPYIAGTAHLTLADAGFSSADGSVVCEGIRMDMSGGFKSSILFDTVDFTLFSKAAGFELLIDKFYGNFKDKALSLSASGKYTKAGDSLHITESKAGLAQIGDIYMTGIISGLTKSPIFDTYLQINKLSNKEVYDFFIRETFQGQFPVISQLSVNGESSMKFKVNGTPERFTVTGDINVSDMDIVGKGPVKALKGINIDLPVELSYPEALRVSEEKRFGTLRIKDVSWSAVKLKDIEAFPSVRRNAVIFKDDIKLPVMGGYVVLKNILFSDILSPGRKLHLSVDIKDIDLEELSAAAKLPAFSGRLSGTIPTVSFYENRLLTEGDVSLEVFGGRIRIGNLSADNVFSPIVSLKSSIEVDEIDLGRMTGAFDFGHISGVVYGKIDDLVIVDGQAQTFKAYMETRKKKGVSQEINVDALKKISILGTGSSTSLLDRGIYRFFKEYKYEKLGFKAFLKNDNLLLLGIETEGNKGYLVKGSLLPPKVDIINYNQNISFQEMTGRLKRIKQIEQ